MLENLVTISIICFKQKHLRRGQIKNKDSGFLQNLKILFFCSKYFTEVKSDKSFFFGRIIGLKWKKKRRVSNVFMKRQCHIQRGI